MTGPAGLFLTIEHPPSWSPAGLAARYSSLVPSLDAGEPAQWHVGTTIDTDDPDVFTRALMSAELGGGAWTIETESGASLTAYLDDRWVVEGSPPPEFDQRAWASWMRGALDVVRDPDCHGGGVSGDLGEAALACLRLHPGAARGALEPSRCGA